MVKVAGIHESPVTLTQKANQWGRPRVKDALTMQEACPRENAEKMAIQSRPLLTSLAIPRTDSLNPRLGRLNPSADSNAAACTDNRPPTGKIRRCATASAR